MEVAGAFAVTVRMNGDAQIFGALGRDSGPVFMNAGDGEDFTVSVPLDAHLDFQAVQGRRIDQLTQDNIQCIVQSLAELDSLADIVIVDTGAGISDAVMEFLVASGEILLVTTPEPTSITDSYSLLKALSRHPKYAREDTKIKMVANKVQKKGDGS